VIGSSIAGGSIDVVVPDVTGYIVDPRDIAALAAAITKLAADPERRRAMG
jgi:glycosyltransferase involved in cell wall biosynthesis